MRFSVGCEIGYELLSESTLIFNIEAMKGGRQRILSETLTIDPQLAADESIAVDSGNRFLRLTAPAGMVQLRYEAEVQLEAVHDQPGTVDEVPVAQLPLEILPFLNPSRYCPSDQLARFAGREWIHAEVDYLSGSSDTTTTAADTFSTRAGVCRDFAHLGITFCRALGIPARFVSCYAWQLEPQDFHAVFEAWLGDRWYLFDATRMAALDGMVRIGCGRDAADTAFATIFGQVNSQPIRVWSEALDGDMLEPWTTDAISVTQA